MSHSNYKSNSSAGWAFLIGCLANEAAKEGLPAVWIMAGGEKWNEACPAIKANYRKFSI